MQPLSEKNRIGNSRIDTERVADLLVRWYGPQAAYRARLRAQHLKKADDLAGYVVWLMIERSIRRRGNTTADVPPSSKAA